jgi:hypothetical protein
MLTPAFFRVCAISSVLSALTTLALILLPMLFAAGSGFEARMARVQDAAYQWRAWIYLAHPFFVMVAATGVAARLWPKHAGWVVPGLLAFLLWGFTEAAQQTMTLVAFDRWRTAYLAGDEAVRATMALRTAVYDGLWDAMYLLLLVGFFFGNVLYAGALRNGGAFGRILAGLFIAAALLTLLLFSGELGGPTLPASIMPWTYLAVQPLARFLIGVWLWQQAPTVPDAR